MNIIKRLSRIEIKLISSSSRQHQILLQNGWIFGTHSRKQLRTGRIEGFRFSEELFRFISFSSYDLQKAGLKGTSCRVMRCLDWRFPVAIQAFGSYFLRHCLIRGDNIELLLPGAKDPSEYLFYR